MTDSSGAADWISAGLALVDFGRSIRFDSDGLVWESSAISYHPTQQVVQGDEFDYPVVVVNFEGFEDFPGWQNATATFNLNGLSDQGAIETRPPMLANVGFVCTNQSGWGEGARLTFIAEGLPSATGTAEQPYLWFRCRLNLEVAGRPTDAVVHFDVAVSSTGLAHIREPGFEHGIANIDNDGYLLTMTYNVASHGG